MKEGQKDIFYMAADSLDAASSAPFVERLVQRDYEVSLCLPACLCVPACLPACLSVCPCWTVRQLGSCDAIQAGHYLGVKEFRLLSVCLSVRPSVCLSVRLSVSVSLFVHLLSVCLLCLSYFTCLFVCLFLFVSACLLALALLVLSCSAVALAVCPPYLIDFAASGGFCEELVHCYRC